MEQQEISSAILNQREVAKCLYQPLCTWQTRLIQLKPNLRDAPLELDLIHVDLVIDEGVLTTERKLVQYQAVSYCWGDNSPTKSCSCNGLDYPITANLETALRRLRDVTSSRLLWVDAICINQHDNDEKSVQVQKMLTIFAKANYVIVWLGEAREHQDRPLVHKLLNDLLTHDDTIEEVAENYRAMSIQEKHLIFRELCLTPWLGRVWVRQVCLDAMAW